MLKNFEDLTRIKDNYLENKKNKTLIKVSMSTCGITAGADVIYNFFQEEIDRIKKNARKNFIKKIFLIPLLMLWLNLICFIKLFINYTSFSS